MAACQASPRGAEVGTRRSAPRGPRRLAVVAAAQRAPPNSAATASRHAHAVPKQWQLARLVLQQASKEAWGGWLGDLVLPLVSDDTGSQPPPATLAPHELADSDSRFVRVDGVAVHYKEAWPAARGAAARDNGSNNSSSGNGSGSGGGGRPVLLLVHGFNGSVFNWRTAMQPLADATGCRVLAFDRPPFGLTERPLTWGEPGAALQYNPYELQGSARLVEGLLDALGIERVVAVGHSAGALVGMELALRQPQRVAALGFVAPALPTTPENGFTRRANLGSQLRFLAVRALLGDDRLGLRYVRRSILKRRDEVAAGKLDTHGEDSEVPQDVIDGYLKPLQAEHWDRASLLNFRAFSIPPTYQYDALGVPVLLVQGSNDGALTRNARDLAQLLQGRPQGSTQFVELQGVGHVPMDECPDRLNELVAEFVQQSVLGQGATQQAQQGQQAAASPRR